MHVRRIAITLGALALSLGLAGSAHAAQATVSYDLTDTVFWTHFSDRPDANESNPVQINIGSMAVVYTTDTLYQVQPGQATITSFSLYWSGSLRSLNVATLTPRSTGGNQFAYWQSSAPYCDFNGNFCNGGAALLLTTPAQGTVSGGKLKVSANMYLKAILNTRDGAPFPKITQAVNFSVPVGSVASTHWLDGRTTAAGVSTTNAGGGTTGGGGHFAAGTGTLYSGSFGAASTTITTGQFSRKLQFPGEVTLVGREIQRDPAKIPEPGSLLLLGSGLAGLAALGSGSLTRRLRRRS